MTQHVSISPQAWVHSIVSLWVSSFLVFCSHMKSKLKFLCSKTLYWFCISHAKHQVSSRHPPQPPWPILEPEAALRTYFIFWPFKSQHIGAQPFPTCQAFLFLMSTAHHPLSPRESTWITPVLLQIFILISRSPWTYPEPISINFSTYPAAFAFY